VIGGAALLFVGIGIGSSSKNDEDSQVRTADAAEERVDDNETGTTENEPEAQAAATVGTTTTTEPAPTTTRPKPTTTKAAPTTTTIEEGSRGNPFPGTTLTMGDWDTVSIGFIEDVDPALIRDANQFNDELLDGQKFVRIPVSAHWSGIDVGSPLQLSWTVNLAGDKGKIYEEASVSDSRDVLAQLGDQPDVLEGGAVTGFVYYRVDVDDANLLIVVDSSDGPRFATPGG
jgi:hypothetical protein